MTNSHIYLDTIEYISYTWPCYIIRVKMDKLRMLKRLDASEGYNLLSPDEIRLYILLFMNSKKMKKGEIEIKRVRDAMGTAFSPDKIISLCEKLNTRGLIEILSDYDRTIDEDAVLTYRILPYTTSNKGVKRR